MLAFISHTDCLLHKMDVLSPEQPERIKVIADTVKNSNLSAKLSCFDAPLVKRNDLLRVHDGDYIDFIFSLKPENKLISLAFDTYMSVHTLNAALRAAGSAILAVDLVMEKNFNAAFCNVRPPGHHAERNRAMGFCFFNNVAVSTAYAFDKYKLKRIAIIDFDVHHGNGTEDIFKDNDNLLFCSSFQHPFYPYHPFSTEREHLLNLPLPAGTTGKAFREHVKMQWLDKIASFKPEMIFISAGFDAHEADTMANFNLHEDDYAWLTKKIKKIADKHCPNRLISILEGGYEQSVLGNTALTHIRNLI